MKINAMLEDVFIYEKVVIEDAKAHGGFQKRVTMQLSTFDTYEEALEHEKHCEVVREEAFVERKAKKKRSVEEGEPLR